MGKTKMALANTAKNIKKSDLEDFVKAPVMKKERKYHNTEMEESSIETPVKKKERKYHNTEMEESSIETPVKKKERKHHYMEMEDSSIETPAKKKERKYHNTEMEESSIETPVKKKKRNYQTTEIEESSIESPKKKKKNYSSKNTEVLTDVLDKEYAGDEEDLPLSPGIQDDTIDEEDLTIKSEYAKPYEDTVADGDLRTFEEELQGDRDLLLVVLDQLEDDTKPFSATLNAMNFDLIATHFPDASADECKKKVKHLIDKTPKIKCLSQVISETLENLSKRKRINKYSNFMMKNKQKIDEAIKEGRGKTQFAVASLLWNELTSKEQALYVTGSVKSRKLGKSPFQVFYEAQKLKGPKLPMIKARQKWITLKLSKKIRCIEKSAMLKMKLLQEIVNEDEKDAKKFNEPAKTELALYLEYMNAPIEPKKHVAIFYHNRMMKFNSKAKNKIGFLAISEQFRKLDEKKQNYWQKELNKAQRKYNEELEEWKQSQNEVTLFIFDQFNLKKEERANIKNRKNKEGLHSVEMPVVGKLNFPGEPCIPPLTALQTYSKDCERKGIKKPAAEMKKQFHSLDKDTQALYAEKSRKIRDVFILGLKSLVRNMVPDQRKVFLGMKRVRFLRLLRVDIFAEDYPAEDYPVYVHPKKDVSNKQTKFDYGLKNEKDMEYSDKEVTAYEDKDDEEEIEDSEREIPAYQAKDAVEKHKKKKAMPVQSPEKLPKKTKLESTVLKRIPKEQNVDSYSEDEAWLNSAFKAFEPRSMFTDDEEDED